jgi:hypothetical protein
MSVVYNIKTLKEADYACALLQYVIQHYYIMAHVGQAACMHALSGPMP